MTREEGALEQAWRIIRRRKIIVLQALIGLPLIALALTLTQEKEYTATATLLFRETPAALGEVTGVIDPTREAATNGELVALPVVAEEVENTTNGALTAGEVLGAIEVTPSSNADTAAISATTPSPERSAQIANAYGAAYISFRRNADREQVQGAIELAEQSLAEMTPEEAAGPQGEALKKELDQLKLNQALQTGGAELVQRASAPSEPSSPDPKKNVALGIVLGALLGFVLAALLERVDRRVRTSEEMEELYGLPLVGRIPRSRRLATATAAQEVGAQTLEGEAFRALRANLRYFSVDRKLKSILIVSPEEGDGKSTVARGLAMTMAEMGDHAVLVEADLRKGSSFRQMTGQPAPGLSNVLTGMPLDSALVHIHVQAPSHAATRALAVLPSGPIPPNPSELLESQRMHEVLDDLNARYEVVILDSPALGAVSDALAVVPEASEIVVVGGLGKTTRDAARELDKQFSLLDKKPVGVIVNFAEAERAKYSHYYRPDLVGNGASSG
ncbi:MAG TPA: polysaccharide biosynthesis tyrosine autokinase [Solirubrobacterales bacterium]|nr:polysaccharide biosynthesis tyrosine autokinase [Solirubrobacterales bacterium]